MGKGHLTAPVHGLKLDMLHQCASRWDYIGNETEQHHLNMREIQRFGVAYSGHAIALTVRLASCLVARLPSRIETSTWRYCIYIVYKNLD
jgi:hypothetical protein